MSAPDTDATVPLPAQYVAVHSIMLRRQIGNLKNAVCALSVQALTKMEDTLNDQSLHLEQQIACLRANLP